MKKIAIQGIAGSFHEDAARNYFGDEEIEVVECKSFQRVCELIDSDQVDIAVMAIENSIAGSIIQNYSLIRDFHLRVIGEIYIHIQMNLMMLPELNRKTLKQFIHIRSLFGSVQSTSKSTILMLLSRKTRIQRLQENCWCSKN